MASFPVAAASALAVLLGGAGALWWFDLRDRFVFPEKPPPPLGAEATSGEGRPQPVRLAFFEADGRTMVEEGRELSLGSSVAASARAIVEALQAGSRRGAPPLLSPAVRLRHLFLDKRGVLYLDFSAELLEGSGSRQAAAAQGPAGPGAAGGPGPAPGPGEGAPAPAAAAAAGHPEPAVRAALAIAASLGLSLPEVAQVMILVEGRPVPVQMEGVDLRRPLPAALPAAAAGAFR